jgi:hypothetical protein
LTFNESTFNASTFDEYNFQWYNFQWIKLSMNKLSMNKLSMNKTFNEHNCQWINFQWINFQCINFWCTEPLFNESLTYRKACFGSNSTLPWEQMVIAGKSTCVTGKAAVVTVVKTGLLCQSEIQNAINFSKKFVKTRARAPYTAKCLTKSSMSSSKHQHKP